MRKTLESLRNEDSVELSQSMVISLQEKLEVDDPLLPRTRTTPARLGTGSSEVYHPTEPKDLFRQQYFECLDLVTAFKKERFDQPSFQTLTKLDNLLLKSA